MTNQTILRLIEIFKLKLKIERHFLILLRPLKRIRGDIANVYSEEFQKIVIEKRPFKPKSGFLPLVDKLIEVNRQLISYQDALSSLGENVHPT